MYRQQHYFRGVLLSLVILCVVFMVLLTGWCQNSTDSVPASSWKRPSSNDCGVTPKYSKKYQGECVVPALIPFEKRFRVVPRHQLNVCVIEKNMSTVLTAIACFLFNETRFREHHRQINKELFHRRLCGFSNEAFSMDHLLQKFSNISGNSQEESLSSWVHLAVVRHPIQRFLSAFVDKCVLEQTWHHFPARCNGCKDNMTCFVYRQHHRMLQFSAGAKLNSFDDRHFFPQNWRCHFSAHFRRFRFIHFYPDKQGVQSFFAELFDQLRQVNVTENAIEFIRNQSSQGKTPHSTFEREERKVYEEQLKKDADLMHKLVQMYYYDFVLFGFAIPQIN